MIPEIEMDALAVIGICVVIGVLGASLVKRFKFPQIVGFIIMGIVIGETGFNLVTSSDLEAFSGLTFFALGIIGFLVGSEIKLDDFKKYGRQFTSILLGEGLSAFLLVFASITILIYALFHNLAAALAAGMVFGAIASATDPASTMDVLSEYRSSGVLTTTLIAIVALDDALSMTLYGVGKSISQLLAGENIHIGSHMAIVLGELAGSVLLGMTAGFCIAWIIKHLRRSEYILPLSIGILLTCIGLSQMYHFDVILMAIAGGFVMRNVAGEQAERLIDHMRKFSSPIYILFFVLVGARLHITSVPFWMWVIVLIYVAGRTIGKIGGAYVGARLAGSPSVIRKNTGVGLFAQGGVAIGLCIMAQTHLQSIQLTPELTLGDAVVFGVTLSTFFVQLIGPPLLKSVIYRTQEAEKKLTVEQAAQRYTVADVIDNSVSIISAEVPLKIAFEKLQYSPYSVLPVVNKTGRTLGLLSMEQVKTLISDHASWDWMIASDLMIENNQPVYARTRLDEALHYLQQHGTNQAVVIDNRDSKKPVGVLTLQHIEEKLKQVVPDMKELQVSHA